MNQNTVVPLHNVILHSKKKEGAPTFSNSIDGTGKYYAKWNKPVCGGQASLWNIIWSHLYEESNEQNKLTNKIELEDGNVEQTDSGEEGNNGGKKRKGLVKGHVWMTHGHGQQCANWVWEQDLAVWRTAKEDN